MRTISLTQGVLAVGIVAAAQGAHADCNDAVLDGSTISGKLVCAYKPASGGTDPNQRWSEIHNATTGAATTLGEHGRGTTDPNGSYDANVGTWAYSAGSITYTYIDDSSSPYTWTLHGIGGTTPTSFCSGSTEIATIHAVIDLGSVNAADTNPCGW